MQQPTSILIPLGRSLQRLVAAPEFFKFPRIVTGITSLAKFDAKNLGLNLKNRLFLGYVEPAQQIEVISFNDQICLLIEGLGSILIDKIFMANRNPVSLGCLPTGYKRRVVWGASSATFMVAD